MNRCDHFQALMLDHVYGLVEGANGEELVEHLEGCPACQRALAEAHRQQGLLAAAARREFPDVSFQAPAAEDADDFPSDQPAARAGWLRWAVAAGILLAVGALGISSGKYAQQHDRIVLAEARLPNIQQEIAGLNKDFEQSRAKMDQANQELQEVARAFQNIEDERHTRRNQIQEQTRRQQPSFRMNIHGPKNPDLGAQNQYRIETLAANQQPVAALLSVRVLDGQQRAVYEVKDAPSQGQYQFDLPRNLLLEPNADLALEVRARDPRNNAEKISHTLKLVAPLYLTHLATDKPMYQPGEVVRFRSLTLERFSLKPAQEDMQLAFVVTGPNGQELHRLQGVSQITDGAGQGVLLGPDQKPIGGIGAGEYKIDAGADGGEYTLTVSEAQNRFPPQQRKFIVNKYEKPRLNKELEFTRKSYGPGATVTATCKAKRVDGNQPEADKPVTASINVDGQVFAPENKNLRTDATGSVDISFPLPNAIERGVASLTVIFTDGGSTETIVRSIPIVLQKLQVEFFPEGGYLIAGVPNQVYFQARTTLGKPAELKGRIVDEQGTKVVDVHTFNDPTQPGANQGMGRFELAPKAGKRYRLVVDEPAGIQEILGPGAKKQGEFLEDAKDDGVVLSVPSGVTTDKEPIRVVVTSAKKPRSLFVGVYCRGRLMAHERVEAKAGQAVTLALQPAAGAGGVYRVTVFEETPGDVTPRAERLIYRAPAERLNLALKPNRPGYAPREQVMLGCSATDEKGRPAPAVLMLAVVDNRVLKLADEKTYRQLPTHFLLTTEVRRPEDLEHADFLLGNNAKAGIALDLLLGTQGWRRFAEQDPLQFQKTHPQEAARMLAVNSQMRVEDNDLAFQARQKEQKLDETLAPRRAPLLKQKAQGEELRSAALAQQALLMEQRGQLEEEAKLTQAQYRTAVNKVNAYHAFGRKLRGLILPALALVLLLGGLISLATGIWRKRIPHSLPYLVTACCSIALFGFVTFLQFGAGESDVFVHDVKIQAPAWWPAGNADPAVALLDEAKPASRVGENRKQETEADKGEGKVAGAPVDDGLAPGRIAPRAEAPFADAQRQQNKADQGQLGQQGQAEKAGQAPRPAQLAPPRFDMKDMALPPGAKMPAPAGRPLAPLPQPVNEPRAPAEAAKKLQGAGQEFLKKNREELHRVPAEAAQERLEKGKELQNQQEGFARPAAKALGDMPAAGPAAGKEAAEQERRDLNKNQRRRFMEQENFDRDKLWLGPRRLAPQPFVVRVYAHASSPSQDGVRQDYAETLYWHPALVLPDGSAEVAFNLCDSATSFQVLVAGHTLDGRLGAVTMLVDSRLPLTLEPKLPIEVTSSDKIDVPLTVANNTSSARTIQVQVQPTGLTLQNGKTSDTISLGADQRTRRVYRFQPSVLQGEARLQFDGQSAGVAGDGVLRTFQVVPDGFPIVGSKSDLLEKTARNEIVLPKDMLPGTLQCQVNVYPSTLADLQKGLESLLREPHGCFEQTSTSNYPNLLILDYLKESNQSRPEVARRAQDLLNRGYQKLTSFECTTADKKQREGYEWFGGAAPPHEALTAYGLMQFRDMARVHNVDKTMVERTRSYLLSRRDGQGGFKRNPRALDTFGRAPDHITNAYIVWALTEDKDGPPDDLTQELALLQKQAQESKDPYFLALVANILLNRNQSEAGVALLKRSAELQQKDGHLNAERTSITGSGGRDLQIETTALTLYGWLKARRPDLFNANVQNAVKWLGQQRGGYGGFGSTQSTILALKALIAYAHSNKRTVEAGELTFFVGDREVARQPFAAGMAEAIVLNLPDAEKNLRPGKNDVRIEVTGQNVFPYTLTWKYQTLTPVSAEQCAVRLITKLARAEMKEGESVRLTATVENTSGQGQGMALAILGLPAGLTLPEDMKQLQDLARPRNDGTEPGVISHWEVRGRELVLYWRDLAPGKKIEVNLDLIARVPGEYRGPASRAYLYYNADHKCWIEPIEVKIKAKGE